jgi:hypothetical protein
MGSGIIVVVNIPLQHTPQLCIVDDQEVVQTLLAHGSDPALGKSIRIRGCSSKKFITARRKAVKLRDNSRELRRQGCLVARPCQWLSVVWVGKGYVV